MATMLIQTLPAAERAALGACFMCSGDHEYAIDGDDWRRSEQGIQAALRLAQIPSAALDSYPDAPLFYMHLGASQRTIVRDVEDLVRRWKRRRGIPERRFHADKLPLYLQAWDLREGWKGDGYDRTREHTLAQIAKQLDVPVSTAASRYIAGFRMITGHEFSPDVWRRIVAPLKLSEVFVEPEILLSAPMRRRLQSPVRRPVPDTVVSPEMDQPHTSSVVERETQTVGSEQESVDLLLDAEDLIAKGLADEEVAKRLEVSPEIIHYIRGRTNEFQQI
jgi:hypothetical protein